MSVELWQQCVELLRDELPAQQFNTWIRPLQVEAEGDELRVYAPNRFVLDWVNEKYLGRLLELLGENGSGIAPALSLLIGSRRSSAPRAAPNAPVSAAVAASLAQTQTQSQTQKAVPAAVEPVALAAAEPVLVDELAEPSSRDSFDAMAEPATVSAGNARTEQRTVQVEGALKHTSYLNRTFTFDTFVEGKSNQLARAAAWQVADNPKHGYNPLFLYGGVGLGKTHLMHAVGNHLLKKNPNAKVVYLHSERFVADMVKALQLNAINEFKRFYRSVDALLIDDIQFFAGKSRTQEEFFYAFEALVANRKQIIITSDTYPKELKDIEDRLVSRFASGLTVAIEPPELEMRVAILLKKAETEGQELQEDVAFFIAKNLRSNVRELEGALRKLLAFASFHQRQVTVEMAREALKDILSSGVGQITVELIQKTVADYYKIKVSDMYSKRRPNSIALPRQVAMYLAKETTQKSLPEIGELFGGRDHTTVLHGVRKIAALRATDAELNHALHVLEQTHKG